MATGWAWQLHLQFTWWARWPFPRLPTTSWNFRALLSEKRLLAGGPDRNPRRWSLRPTAESNHGNPFRSEQIAVQGQKDLLPMDHLAALPSRLRLFLPD